MGFISRLVNRVKGDQPAATTPDGPNIITRDHHGISRRDISDNALKVLYRLKDAGYQGFLVG
ncbi:MAG: poly(A) polymerase, partial [Oceanospirillaceae bacterium]